MDGVGLTNFGHSVPIGVPLANTTGYVLDSDLRASPIGVVGELYLGGPKVAPEHTARACACATDDEAQSSTIINHTVATRNKT